MIFKVYTARLDHSKINKYLGEVEANDLNEVKQLIKRDISEGGFRINPFYSVIFDKETGKELYNEHCTFYEGNKELTKKYINESIQ